jgi:hypothetical protein
MQQLVKEILDKPYKLGHLVGKDKLTELHGEWIKDVFGSAEKLTAFQAHRGAYKSTALIEIGLPLYHIFHPNHRVALLKETYTEACRQFDTVKKVMRTPAFQSLAKLVYKKPVFEIVNRKESVSWNFRSEFRKEGNLDAYGVAQIPTGTHYDLIICDDIVTINSRISKAVRESVNLFCQEIIDNILESSGRFILIGTPWHENDAFSLKDADGKCIFGRIRKNDVYSTGILTKEQIADKQKRMPASLFSVNYLLQHLPSESFLFQNPQYDVFPSIHTTAHIDLRFTGNDYTALTIGAKHDSKYHIFGYAEQKHFQDMMPVFAKFFIRYKVQRVFMESNPDKGLSIPIFQNAFPQIAFHSYHESVNKHIKISTIITDKWKDIYFCNNTNDDYMLQILEYNEQASHDDAPDSLASWLRETGAVAKRSALYDL